MTMNASSNPNQPLPLLIIILVMQRMMMMSFLYHSIFLLYFFFRLSLSLCIFIISLPLLCLSCLPSRQNSHLNSLSPYDLLLHEVLEAMVSLSLVVDMTSLFVPSALSLSLSLSNPPVSTVISLCSFSHSLPSFFLDNSNLYIFSSLPVSPSSQPREMLQLNKLFIISLSLNVPVLLPSLLSFSIFSLLRLSTRRPLHAIEWTADSLYVHSIVLFTFFLLSVSVRRKSLSHLQTSLFQPQHNRYWQIHFHIWNTDIHRLLFSYILPSFILTLLSLSSVFPFQVLSVCYYISPLDLPLCV